jgi:sigma-B regulation protein RsbU (phosphoserine phosphatase)
MFFGIIDRDGTLEFIRAGHPSPLLIRRGQVSDLYTEGSFPVGLIDEATYTASSLKLEPDDTLVLFSDGVTEAEDHKRELFGFERLREVLDGWQDESLESLKKIVLDSIYSFSRGAPQSDDVTLLVVRYRASAQNAFPGSLSAVTTKP